MMGQDDEAVRLMNRLQALRGLGRRSASGPALAAWLTCGLLGRGLLLVGSGTPRAATAHVALVLLLALLPVLQVWLTKLLLDAVTTRTEGVTAAVSWAVTLAAVYALTLVVLAALTPVQRVLSAWIEERAVAELDGRLIRAGTRLADLVRLERPAFQDRLRLVRQAASQDLPGLFPLLEMGGTPLLSLVGLLLLLGFLHPLLPVVLAAVSVPHFVSEYCMNRLQYQAMARQSRPAREMDYCAAVTTEPAAAKEVRVFGLGDFFLQRFRERRDAALGEMTRVRLVQLKMSTVFSGAYALVLAGGFWYVAAEAGAGHLTLGDLALYLGAVTQAQSVATRMSVWFGMFYGVLARLRALFDFLDQARPAIKLPPPEQGRAAPPALQTGVALRQVSFRYPESAQAVLADMSVVLPAGRVTALVGANGAGKSMLVKLLTRMYDPDCGHHPARRHSPPRLRSGLLAPPGCRCLSRLCPVCADLPREHRGRRLRGRRWGRSHRAGRAVGRCGRDRGPAAARLRHRANPAVRGWRRVVGWRVAEGGAGAGVCAGCGGGDPG